MRDADLKIKSEEYPILEFDPDKTSVTNPETLRYSFKVPANCVLCFFNDVLQELYKRGVTKIIGNVMSSMGPFPIYESELNGKKIALFNPGVEKREFNMNGFNPLIDRHLFKLFFDMRHTRFSHAC